MTMGWSRLENTPPGEGKFDLDSGGGTAYSRRIRQRAQDQKAELVDSMAGRRASAAERDWQSDTIQGDEE